MNDIISGHKRIAKKKSWAMKNRISLFSTCCKLPSMRTAAKRSHCIFTAIQSTVSLKKSSCKT